MTRFRLLKVAGASAVLFAAGLVVLIILMAKTGLLEAVNATEVFPIMVEHRTTTLVGMWLFVLLIFPLAVLGLGLFAALRRAGYVTWVAALALLGGSLLALLRNILLLAMTYELAPAYANATGAVQSALAVLGDTLLMFGFIAGDLVGGILAGGVGVPLFSAAMLRTELVPRWIAFLGFAVAITAGWGTLLLPLGEVFAIVPFVGTIGFLVWLVALGIKLWRAPEPDTT